MTVKVYKYKYVFIQAQLTRKGKYWMIHIREFLSNTRIWLSNTCVTLHQRALQIQHKYAQKIKYTNGSGYFQQMHYKHNIHNKTQTSTIKLILRSHINAFNTARGLVGLEPDRNATLL